LASERNKRCSERHGGLDVDEGKKPAIRQAEQRARRRRVNAMSDPASSAAGEGKKPMIRRAKSSDPPADSAREYRKEAICRAAPRERSALGEQLAGCQARRECESC
jgi:hypothetical protein